jgi:hypothetical protein
MSKVRRIPSAPDWLGKPSANPWWPFVSDRQAGEIHAEAADLILVQDRLRKAGK